MRRRYLERHGLDGAWKLEGPASDIAAYTDAELMAVVVLPALAEGYELFATLDSLAANSHAALRHMLVLVVVNQRCDATPEIRRQNQEDLMRLQEYARRQQNLRLGWIDATAAHTCMPLKRGGVGMARKIGADLVLPHIAPETLVVHLDADTRVEPDYASCMVELARKENFAAGVIAFRHRKCSSPIQQRAIDEYELHMRCHAAGLKWAGSPYAYPSIGSTMVSRAHVYVRAGGMNTRQAGEDFYFLQQLAKIAGIRSISRTCVYPAPRISTRTPFGTGQSMRQACLDGEPLRLFYPLECYAILKHWLQTVTSSPSASADELLDRMHRHSASATEFLIIEGFEQVWKRLQGNHAGAAPRVKAFHEWFDALKSWRLIRVLGEQLGAPCQAEYVLEDFMPLLDPTEIPGYSPRISSTDLHRQDQAKLRETLHHSASIRDFQ
jgi:hypothetical protein